MFDVPQSMIEKSLRHARYNMAMPNPVTSRIAKIRADLNATPKIGEMSNEDISKCRSQVKGLMIELLNKMKRIKQKSNNFSNQSFWDSCRRGGLDTGEIDLMSELIQFVCQPHSLKTASTE